MLDLRPVRPELRLTLVPGARTLRLTSAEVAGQLRAAYLGSRLIDVRQGDLPFDV
jgi:hypothetical protein